jgi:hypothetical protein
VERGVVLCAPHDCYIAYTARAKEDWHRWLEAARSAATAPA